MNLPHTSCSRQELTVHGIAATLQSCTCQKSGDRHSRLEAVKPFKDDISFQSLNFYDISVGFYQPDEDGILGSEDLPEDNNWCFVELTETELERLVPPDNVLVSHILAVFANGEARYRAYGKHTDERFWTEKFPLQQILDILASHES